MYYASPDVRSRQKLTCRLYLDGHQLWFSHPWNDCRFNI